jgi:hypothetical protein
MNATVITGFGERGNSWHLTYTDFTDNMLTGAITGVLIGGESFDGTFFLKKFDEDRFEFQICGTSEGEDLTLIGKSRRKK